jgi:hypothetical protein
MARSFIQTGRLFRVTDAPEFPHPAYMVFPRKADSEVLRSGLAGLRELALQEQKSGSVT